MHITLHLTTGCNMYCNYCYALQKERVDMSREVAIKSIEYGFRLSPNNMGIIFFGGEPLLKKDLIKDIIEYSDNLYRGTAYKSHYKITTNGILLDEEFLEYCKSSHLAVALSFDGIKEAHDLHRKTKNSNGTFDVLEQKLNLLLKYQPYASIYMTVSPETVKYYSGSVEYLIGKGVRYIITSLNYAGNWNKEDLHELRKQYKLLSKLYEKLTLEQKKFFFSPFETKFSSHIKDQLYKCEKCHLGMHQVSVAPDGSIYPCVQFVNKYEYKIGDVFNGINFKKRNGLYNLSTESEKICEGCAIETRCNNSCSCLNLQTTGDINKISPLFCETERMITPIVDKLGEKLYKKKAPLFIQKHYNAVYPVMSLIEDLN